MSSRYQSKLHTQQQACSKYVHLIFGGWPFTGHILHPQGIHEEGQVRVSTILISVPLLEETCPSQRSWSRQRAQVEWEDEMCGDSSHQSVPCLSASPEMLKSCVLPFYTPQRSRQVRRAITCVSCPLQKLRLEVSPACQSLKWARCLFPLSGKETLSSLHTELSAKRRPKKSFSEQMRKVLQVKKEVTTHDSLQALFSEDTCLEVPSLQCIHAAWWREAERSPKTALRQTWPGTTQQYNAVSQTCLSTGLPTPSTAPGLDHVQHLTSYFCTTPQPAPS